MPCNIGYKEYSRIKIPASQPQEFKEKTGPPKIDADLLAKIGETDSKFLEWLEELDILPLLEESLLRALAKVKESNLVSFTLINEGFLEANAKYTGSVQKKKIENITGLVFERFQIEVLGVVAQLLDYEIYIYEVTINGKKSYVLEGEKIEDTDVHKYIKIAASQESASSISFEHFVSQKQLKDEKIKLLGIAQKLGVKIVALDAQEAWQPITQGMVHRDFLKAQ